MSAQNMTAEEWLEWANGKWEVAQERFAYGSKSAGKTMASYQALISAIECGIAKRAEHYGLAMDEGDGMVDVAALRKIADDLETKARRVDELSPHDMHAMASAIRTACRAS